MRERTRKHFFASLKSSSRGCKRFYRDVHWRGTESMCKATKYWRTLMRLLLYHPSAAGKGSPNGTVSILRVRYGELKDPPRILQVALALTRYPVLYTCMHCVNYDEGRRAREAGAGASAPHSAQALRHIESTQYTATCTHTRTAAGHTQQEQLAPILPTMQSTRRTMRSQQHVDVVKL